MTHRSRAAGGAQPRHAPAAPRGGHRLPGRGRLRGYVDHAGLPARRGQPWRTAAPLPDQERPGHRRRRAPEPGPPPRSAARRQLPTGPRRTRAVLGMLADHFVSPVFTAALELWVAARTDAQLLAAVAPLEQRIGREVHRITVDLLGVDESRPGARELIQATLDLVRGLGLADTISDDAAAPGRILDQWATSLDNALQGDRMSSVLEAVLADLTRRATASKRVVASTSTRAGGHANSRRGLGHRHHDRAPGVDRRGPIAARSATAPRKRWDATVMKAIANPRASSTRGLRRREGVPRRSSPAGRLPSGARRDAAQLPGGQKLPWYGPPMSPTSMATARFMETWAHGLDIDEALGVRPSPPTGSSTSRTSASAPATSPSACTASPPGRGVPDRAEGAVR